jgi:enoyl-[acyl-carrier protein] reductase/trans-2-enoyl-CoA reductase (NAD+)
MVVQEKIIKNVCLTAHPLGCREYVKNEIDFVKKAKKGDMGELYQPISEQKKNVLVLGCSTGYGLSSRIVSAFGFKNNTIGVSFERAPNGKRTASPGWYNNKVFDELAEKENIYSKTLNGDAFSSEMKKEVVDLIKKDLGKIDLVIYSVASPMRIDPVTKETYKSVLKTTEAEYTNFNVDLKTEIISKVSLEKATDKQIQDTIKVMGSEDWKLWIQALIENDCLNDNCQTIAYSYIGPKLTYPIYREGTIGRAKKDLENGVSFIDEQLKKLNGKAYVSVNKALVTRASAVIPIVPLYIALLYKVMKDNNVHENCIEQVYRLFSDKLPNSTVDEKGRIRLDDFEMRDDIQFEVEKLWKTLIEGEKLSVGDLQSFKRDYSHLHGFGYKNIDYSKDVDLERP